MKLNTAATTLFSLALLGLGTAFATTTATTDPVGFSNLAIPVGTSLVVPTLNNSSVYAGMAAINAAGTTITPVTAPGWTAGAYNKTAFANPTPNYPTHYAEVVAGAQEGLIIDIDSNSTTALSCQANEIPASIRGTTVQIVIRPHMTLDKLIEGATGLSAYQDAVSVYNGSSVPSVRYYDGDLTDGSNFLDDSFTSPAGHTVVYPGTGLVITVANPVTLTFLGGVKVTKTQVNLYANATNIIGPMNPASSTKLYDSTALAQAMTPYQDGFNNFSTDGHMIILQAYSSDGSVILDSSFNPLTLSSPDAIPLNRGIVLTVTTDSTWIVPTSVPAGP